MTGLSSVAGAPLQAQVRDAFDAAQRGSYSTLDPELVNAARLAGRMLKSAVQKVEMERVVAERRTVDPEFADAEANQPQTRGDPTGSAGHSLDVVA